MTITPEGATFTAMLHGCDQCRVGRHTKCKKAVDIHDQENQPGGGDEGYLPSPRCVCFDQNRDEHMLLVQRAAEAADKAVASCGICQEPLTFDQPGDITYDQMQNVIGKHLREKHPGTLKQRAGDQALPTVTDAADIQSLVISDIEKRRAVGIERYGTALQPFNGRNTLLDAYEESVDKTVYLKSLLVMRDAMRTDLVAAAYRGIVKQWYENAEQKIEDSPEGFSQQLAEIAVDAILDAFVENSAAVRQG